MRNITKYILISACTLMLNSCDAYLDKQPDDAMTMEMICLLYTSDAADE